MRRERHLASLVVHARPRHVAGVTERMERLGLEVHIASPDGKIVVTQETESSGALGDTLTALQLMDGVLAAAMVFHHCDRPEDAPQQDTDPEEVQP